MHPVYVMLAIAKAKEQTTKLVPIMFDDVSGTGLKVVRTTKDQNNRPLFAYVDRLEYIKHLESKHQLIKKRAAIRNVLRDCIRKS